MNWYNSLSTSNKIALLSLFVGIIGIIIAFVNFFSASSLKDKQIGAIEELFQSTTGENSPVIKDTNGNIEIKYSNTKKQ